MCYNLSYRLELQGLELLKLSSPFSVSPYFPMSKLKIFLDLLWNGGT